MIREFAFGLELLLRPLESEWESDADRAGTVTIDSNGHVIQSRYYAVVPVGA